MPDGSDKFEPPLEPYLSAVLRGAAGGCGDIGGALHVLHPIASIVGLLPWFGTGVKQAISCSADACGKLGKYAHGGEALLNAAGHFAKGQRRLRRRLEKVARCVTCIAIVVVGSYVVVQSCAMVAAFKAVGFAKAACSAAAVKDAAQTMKNATPLISRGWQAVGNVVSRTFCWLFGNSTVAAAAVA